MNRNLQAGIHPDADQLSVFVEGAASVREQETMLAHLAECAECRKAVFLMRPHEETQRAAATREKGWMWRRLIPVGLPVAALACGLIAVLIYIRPYGAPATPQQMASVRQRETERPGVTAAPSINSEQVAGTGKPQNRLAPNTAVPNATTTRISPQQTRIASGLNLPTLKSGRAIGSLAPQTMATAPSATAPSASVQTADAAPAQSAISSAPTSDLPLNGRNVVDLQQLEPPSTKGAASLTASAQNETLAGISGRITDRTGAVIVGVTVTLRDAADKTRQSTTGTDGTFQLTQLPAGQYELTAAASGFKTSQMSIDLKPSELAMLQPVLDVGATSEVVEVEAGSSAVAVQTESANVSGQAVAEMTGAHRAITLPSGVRIAQTVSHGKRSLSLDDAGNLFLSRNGGKKWNKVKPQWAGKAIRIELTSVSEAAQKPKNETSGAAGEGAVFLLTTDGGTVWNSKDGAHWHQQ